MKQSLWKIAHLSERGRKKENRALFWVLCFLFFLIAAGITWFSISRKTREEQRFETFGEWKAAFYDGSREQAEAFAENPATVRSGISRVAGTVLAPDFEERMAGLNRQFEAGMEANRAAAEEMGMEMTILPPDEYSLEDKIRSVMWLSPEEEADVSDYFGSAGVLGTLDEGAAELGRVRLKEGRMPEKTGEIAMTEELLSVLGQDQKTGDPITLYVAGGDWQVEKITCTLSGILDSYGGGWNKKGYPVVSAAVSEDSLEALPWEASWNVFTDINGTVSDTIEIYGISEMSMEETAHFAYNNLAYDFYGRTDYSFVYAVLLIVFLISFLAVIQISAGQVRRRSRQVSLMKAIGATDRQVAGLFLRELFLMLWKAVLIGTAAGIGITAGVLWLAGSGGTGRIWFHLDLPLMAAGILLGCAVVCLSALFPVRQGARIPLRGEFSPKVHRIAPLDPGKKHRNRNLIAAKSGGLFRLGTVLLLTILAGVSLISIYLAGQSLYPCLSDSGVPVFNIGSRADVPYSEESRNLALLEELSQLPGIGACHTEQSGMGGSGLYLSYDGLADSSLEPLRKQWNDRPYDAGRADLKDGDWALANTVGIYTDWDENVEEAAGMVTEGRFDREAFAAGEEVLLYLPGYRIRDVRGVEVGESKIEYNNDPLLDSFFLTDDTLEAGEELTIQVRLQEPAAGQTAEAAQADDSGFLYSGVREFHVKVGGIVRYLPEEAGLRWDPEGLGAFCVIGSHNFVNQMRAAWRELQEEYGQSVSFQSGPQEESLYDTVSLKGSRDMDGSTWGSLQGLTGSRGLYLNGDYEEWKTEYEEALDQTVRCVTAGIGIGFVMLCFLVQSTGMRLREDRRKLGILQALGIRKREVRQVYAVRGMVNGAAALALSHLGLILAAVLRHREAIAALNPYRYSGIWERLLVCWKLMFSGYSWPVHILVCVLVFAFSILLYQVFLNRLLSESPTEAVRELGE